MVAMQGLNFLGGGLSLLGIGTYCFAGASSATFPSADVRVAVLLISARFAC